MSEASLPLPADADQLAIAALRRKNAIWRRILRDPPAAAVYDTLYEDELKSGKAHPIFAQAWAGYVETLDEPVAITKWEDGVSTWEVYFGTNRPPDSQGRHFGGGVSNRVTVGRALVTLPKRGQRTLPLRPGEQRKCGRRLLMWSPRVRCLIPPSRRSSIGAKSRRRAAAVGTQWA